MTPTSSSYHYDPPIAEIAAAMKEGRSVLLPLDTIWSIACDAFDQKALENLYRIKNKPLNTPVILLVSDIDMLKEYVRSIHPRIETLLVYHRRPITLIYDSPMNLPAFLTHHDGTVAIRVASDQLSRDIIEQTKSPVAVTSANLHQEPTSTRFDDIPQSILEKVDMVVKGISPLRNFGEASVIASFDEMGELSILRE